ncbi:hypothetical protein BHE74_00022271 [Ensete ventricosum]|nr:hypothetical protein BHE74_00022271 [Ensete ventricosum]
MGVFKPIVLLNCISFEVDDSGVHHGILRCSVIMEVMFGARNPSRRVSFPLWEVHPHAWFCCCCLGWLRILEIGYDDCVLRLEGWLRVAKYDLDPAAKAAAATVLASKLGADSGLKVYVGDEPNRGTVAKGSDVDPVITTGLRNRKQSHARSNSTGSTIVSQMVNETLEELGVDDQEISAQTQKVVEHYKASSANDGRWIARIAAWFVGEDPSQSYALICGNCRMHNEDFPHISYYCPHCHVLNTSRQSGEPDSGSSSGRGISYASVDAKYDNNAVKSEVASKMAEVPKLPTGEKDDKEDALEVS